MFFSFFADAVPPDIWHSLGSTTIAFTPCLLIFGAASALPVRCMALEPTSTQRPRGRAGGPLRFSVGRSSPSLPSSSLSASTTTCRSTTT